MTELSDAATYFLENEDEAKRYKKTGDVLYRSTHIAETVLTVVGGQLETTKMANFGDVVVRNMAVGSSGEQYIIGNIAKFTSRYQPDDSVVCYNIDGESWGVAHPTGVVDGILYFGETFKFISPWDAEMIVHDGDMIVKIPDEPYNKVYRIARKDFDATYVEEKQ